MKYYHIVYNSSQYNQQGQIGLGIRTYTEGTPEEYIQVLDQSGCFGYESGSIAQPSPKALLEDGTLITKMPVTYSFVRLFVPSKNKEIFAYIRTVCVGFDYPYYIKFTAARMDNFVTDVYVFEEYPGTEYAQIFYENPADGSVSFIPKSPAPSPDNEEMKALSVGKMALLPAEEKSFTSATLQVLDSRVVELLLSYFEANRKNIPLLVKCDSSEAPRLMTDLIRVLPADLESNATFYTNYQTEGVKDGYKVFFINEGYQYDYESTGQFQILDLTQGQKTTTAEAELYRAQIESYIQNNDKTSLDKLSGWLLSPLYNTIRSNTAAVKEIMYNYTIEPTLFSLNSLFNNREVWPVMVSYFQKSERNQMLLNEKLETQLLCGQSPEDKASVLLFYNELIAAGFNLSPMIDSCKDRLNAILFESAEYLSSVLGKTKGIGSITRYLIKTAFESHSEYLDDSAMWAWWPETFLSFYTKEDLIPEKVLNRMLADKPADDKLSIESVEVVLQKMNLNAKSMCEVMAKHLSKHASDAATLWPLLEKYLTQMIEAGKELPSMLTLQAINDYAVTPLSINGGMEKWQNLMILMTNGKTGSIDANNADCLLKLALKLQYTQPKLFVFEKGLPHLNEGFFELLKQIREVSPYIELPKLLLRFEQCKESQRFKYISAVKEVYDIKLKTFEKLHEQVPQILSEELYNKIRVDLYGKKPLKSKGEKSDDEELKSAGFISKVTGCFSKVGRCVSKVPGLFSKKKK